MESGTFSEILTRFRFVGGRLSPPTHKLLYIRQSWQSLAIILTTIQQKEFIGLYKRLILDTARKLLIKIHYSCRHYDYVVESPQSGGSTTPIFLTALAVAIDY